jgi:hypothetical protein
MRQSCERRADAPDLEEVSHANAMRRILRSWLAMGFRRHKGRGLFDCGSLSRTRLDIRAGVRPRFSFRCLENSYVTFEPACLPVQLHRVKLSFSLLPRTARARAGCRGLGQRTHGVVRISARVQEIVGRAAEQAEVSLERTLRELAAIAFSDITKAVTWGVHVREEEDGRGERVKVIVNTVSLVPSGRLDEDTAAAISAVSQGSNGAVRIKMHNKLAALVVLGKYLGMFDERPQNTNAVPKQKRGRKENQVTLSNFERYERIAWVYDLLDLPFEYGRYRKIRPMLFWGLSGRILEAGVGTGRNFPFYPPGSQVVGIDLSPAMLAQAERRRPTAVAKVELRQMDVTRLNFPGVACSPCRYCPTSMADRHRSYSAAFASPSYACVVSAADPVAI